jgi:hypothetical protein
MHTKTLLNHIISRYITRNSIQFNKPYVACNNMLIYTDKQRVSSYISYELNKYIENNIDGERSINKYLLKVFYKKYCIETFMNQGYILPTMSQRAALADYERNNYCPVPRDYSMLFNTCTETFSPHNIYNEECTVYEDSMSGITIDHQLKLNNRIVDYHTINKEIIDILDYDGFLNKVEDTIRQYNISRDFYVSMYPNQTDRYIIIQFIEYYNRILEKLSNSDVYYVSCLFTTFDKITIDKEINKNNTKYLNYLYSSDYISRLDDMLVNKEISLLIQLSTLLCSLRNI